MNVCWPEELLGYKLVLICTGEQTIIDGRRLTKTLPSLPFPYVTCGTCGPSNGSIAFFGCASCWLLCKPPHDIKPHLLLHVYTPPLHGHELCAARALIPTPQSYLIPHPDQLSSPCKLTTNSATSASARVVLGGWLQVPLGLAGSARSLKVP